MGRAVWAAVFGLVTGSLLTAVTERLPRSESFVRRRSRCDQCRTPLQPLDLVPIVSFLALRGRCRYCGRPIPRWHVLVEIAAIVLFLLPVVINDRRSLADLVFLWLLLGFLLALTTVDLRHLVLPDVVVALLALTGGVRSAVLGDPGVTSSLLGGTAAFLGLWLLSALPWPRVRQSLGEGGPEERGTTRLRSVSFGPRPSMPTRVEARAQASRGSPVHLPEAVGGPSMGFGDVKLAGALGLTLGLPGALVALFFAFVAGGLVGVALLLLRKATMKSRIPFGPFLAGGATLLLVFPTLGEAVFFTLGLRVE